MLSYTIELFAQAIKRYQGQMREAECGYEEEQRQRQEVDSIKLRTHLFATGILLSYKRVSPLPLCWDSDCQCN